MKRNTLKITFMLRLYQRNTLISHSLLRLAIYTLFILVSLIIYAINIINSYLRSNTPGRTITIITATSTTM